MADPNIPAIDGISDADVARVLLYQGQRSVHAPLTGVVSDEYVQSLLGISDFALTYLDDADDATFRATTGTNNAGNLTAGTLPSARLSGAYTGITGLGTLSSLAVTGATALNGGATVAGVLSVAAFPAETQAVMLSMGWSTGFPVWRVVIESDASFALYCYDPDTGDLVRRGLVLTQAGLLAVSDFLVSGSFLAEGDFEVNTATPNFTGISGSGINLNRDTDGAVMTFVKPFPTGGVGSITISGSSTAYNISSDYRRKYEVENLVASFTIPVDLPPALRNVMQSRPVGYKRVEDIGTAAEGTVYHGYLAHEFAQVCAHGVSGEKDAVDAEGNEVLQMVDLSKRVPDHEAAIQELTLLVIKLSDRVAALEAA